MVLTVVFGTILINQLNQEQGLMWFFSKLFFVVGLIICDVICGHYITELNHATDMSRGIQYKILHGVPGLLLIGIMVSIYIFH